MRGDLQVRQGDTVYVLRDIPIDEKRPDLSEKLEDTTTQKEPEESSVKQVKRSDRSKKGKTSTDKTNEDDAKPKKV